MAFVIADRVQETTTTQGTGTVVLAGAVQGYQSFAIIGNANTTYYTIADQAGTNWEVGIGTYYAGNVSLGRTTVLSSSNSNSLVNFTAGIKAVFVTYPAERAIYADSSNITTITNLVSSNVAITGGNLSSVNVTATTFSSANVNITGGTETNVTYNNVTVNGGTINNLIFTNVSVTGGSLNNVVIGNVTPNVATFTNVTANSVTVSNGTYSKGIYQGAVSNGVIVDYISGTARISTGAADNVTIYNSGLANVALLKISSAGALGVGNTSSYGTSGQFLTSNGNAAAPSWTSNVALAVANSSVVLNSTNATSNGTIGAGYNGISVGPVTVANNVTITVASGQRWLVL